MRSLPYHRALTLIEVLAATAVLALVALGVTPVLRRPAPAPHHDAFDAWLRAYAQDPRGTPQRQADGAYLRRTEVGPGSGPILPGTAAAWELVEVVAADGHMRAWRLLPVVRP